MHIPITTLFKKFNDKQTIHSFKIFSFLTLTFFMYLQINLIKIFQWP